MKTLKSIAGGFALVALVIIGLYGFIELLSESGKSKTPPGVWWNEYHAQVGDWNINISESEHVGEAAFRMVHITSITNNLCGITGHGDLNGKWDRIFWGGFPASTNGFNSYVRTRNGWRWEPCPGDSGMTPIPESEIPKAIAFLDAAMTNRIIENISIVWTRGSTTYLTRK